jgi:esterase/lipase
MKKTLLRILIIFICVYCGFSLFLFIFQRKVLYFSNDQDFQSCKGFLDAKKVTVEGTRMYFKKNSDNLIVFYHGNGGSACDRSFLKETFDKQNLSYIFVEYAGYSNDIEKSSKEKLMRDVEHTNNYIKDHNFSKVILAGESLGASLALYHSSLMNEDKVLLISPFYRLVELAQKRFSIFPIWLLLTERYDNSLWIKDLRDVLILHGENDTLIYKEESEKLFDAIDITNKKRVLILGANHNDIYDFEQTINEIRSYIK